MANWKKAVLIISAVCIGLPGYAYMEIFGTWPLHSVARLTRITQIKFPVHTQLVSGYDEHSGPSEMAHAKLRMPYEDLPAFQSQSRMCSSTATTPAQLAPVLATAFKQDGWNLPSAQPLQQSSFSDGSCTFVWIDKTDRQLATVYVYFDEP